MLGVQIPESWIQISECWVLISECWGFRFLNARGSDSYAVMLATTQLSVHIVALMITNVCNVWRNIWNIEGASYMCYVVQTAAGQNRIFVRHNQVHALMTHYNETNTVIIRCLQLCFDMHEHRLILDVTVSLRVMLLSL